MRIPTCAINHFKSGCDDSHNFDKKNEAKVPRFAVNGEEMVTLIFFLAQSYQLQAKHFAIQRTFSW